MLVQYKLLSGSIHEFVFNKSNRQAMDEYLAHLQRLLPALQEGDAWLSILDLSKSGMVPIRYSLTKINNFTKPYLDVHENRTLLIHDAGAIGQIAHSLVNPLNHNVHFLTSDKREEGLMWLLRG